MKIKYDKCKKCMYNGDEVYCKFYCWLNPRDRHHTHDEYDTMTKLFGTRTGSILIDNGFYSVDDLNNFKYSELLKTRNMGPKRLNTIVDVCKKHNVNIICDIEESKNDTIVCPCCGYIFSKKDYKN